MAFLLPPVPLDSWAGGGDPTLIVLAQVAHLDVYLLDSGTQSKQKLGDKDKEGPCATYSFYTCSDFKCKPCSVHINVPPSLGHLETLLTTQIATSWLYITLLLTSLFQNASQP